MASVGSMIAVKTFSATNVVSDPVFRFSIRKTHRACDDEAGEMTKAATADGTRMKILLHHSELLQGFIRRRHSPS
jgi:hypothetical protein